MNRISPARLSLLISSLVLPMLALPHGVQAGPSVQQAFGLVPMQADVNFDKPAATEFDQFAIKAETEGDRRAWVVRRNDGTIFRRFTDTNGDNRIDRWCYFQHGVEVYRDIDSDYNEKADQYRWFGTEGIRWALDTDEDGTIDQWKWISPEEVSSELVRAIQTQNLQRFTALLISEKELAALELSTELRRKLASDRRSALSSFEAYARKQTTIEKNSNWVDFSALRPGVIPASGPLADKDLIVYENAIAMIETAGKHAQLPVGTLIQVDQAWRLTGLPSDNPGGLFFAAANRTTLPVASVSGEMNEKLQSLIGELETLDQKLASASPQQIVEIHQQRTELLRKLALESSGDERDMWVMQLIDSVVAASQPEQNPRGLAQLKRLLDDVASLTKNRDLTAHAKFAYLTAEYSHSLTSPDVKLAEVQSDWTKSLRSFIHDFDKTRSAAEAMLQLAISEEFAGEMTEAKRWYGQIARDYPGTDLAAKGAGAMRRLESVGQPLNLQGRDLAGKPLSINDSRGKLTVVQYWATWCDPCKQDMQSLKTLLQQYGDRQLAVIGVNLDDDARAASTFASQNRLPWNHLYDQGGLDSDLAKQMGIFTLPVMMLVDEQGKVVNRTLTIAELESELKKRRLARRRK